MFKLCRVDIDRSEEIFGKIKRYTERVIKELNPDKVILFGSFATGQINEGSDVDIIVVANFKESFLDRIKLLLNLNEGLPLEPFGYTPQEFELMRKKISFQDIIKNSIILYCKKEGNYVGNK